MSKLTAASFSSLIDKINKSTSDRRQDIQAALEFAAYCAQADRNADPAIRLFAVVGRETNRQNMAKWLSELAPIGFKDGTPFFHEKKWKGWTGTLVEFEQGLFDAVPWYLLKTAASEIPDTVDVLEQLRHFLKKLERDVAKEVNGAKRTVKHEELLAQVAALANSTEYK